MNAQDYREELEVRIVAQLLGEASPFEAAELQAILQKDPELVAFRDQMQRTIGLVRETAKNLPAMDPKAGGAEPKLAAEKRQTLLQTFQKRQENIVPLEPAPRRLNWLVPLGIAAAAIVLVGLFLPALAKSKAKGSRLAHLNTPGAQSESAADTSGLLGFRNAPAARGAAPGQTRSERGRELPAGDRLAQGAKWSKDGQWGFESSSHALQPKGGEARFKGAAEGWTEFSGRDLTAGRSSTPSSAAPPAGAPKVFLPTVQLANSEQAGTATAWGRPSSGPGGAPGGSGLPLGSLGPNQTATVGAGWESRIHQNNGNVVLGDGSVQQLSSSALRTQLSGNPAASAAVAGDTYADATPRSARVVSDDKSQEAITQIIEPPQGVAATPPPAIIHAGGLGGIGGGVVPPAAAASSPAPQAGGGGEFGGRMGDLGTVANPFGIGAGGGMAGFGGAGGMRGGGASFASDPEWIGALQNPNQPHSGSGRSAGAPSAATVAPSGPTTAEGITLPAAAGKPGQPDAGYAVNGLARDRGDTLADKEAKKAANFFAGRYAYAVTPPAANVDGDELTVRGAGNRPSDAPAAGKKLSEMSQDFFALWADGSARGAEHFTDLRQAGGQNRGDVAQGNGRVPSAEVAAKAAKARAGEPLEQALQAAEAPTGRPAMQTEMMRPYFARPRAEKIPVLGDVPLPGRLFSEPPTAAGTKSAPTASIGARPEVLDEAADRSSAKPQNQPAVFSVDAVGFLNVDSFSKAQIKESKDMVAVQIEEGKPGAVAEAETLALPAQMPVALPAPASTSPSSAIVPSTGLPLANLTVNAQSGMVPPAPPPPAPVVPARPASAASDIRSALKLDVAKEKANKAPAQGGLESAAKREAVEARLAKRLAETPPAAVGEKAKYPAQTDRFQTTLGREEGRSRKQLAAAEDRPTTRSIPLPPPPPETVTTENPFSTFSLHVSDVSFKLAAAGLEKGVMPEAASIRAEEFINAFNYHDPAPVAGARLAFAWERGHYPFAHNRDVLRFAVQTAARGREAGKPLNLVVLLDNSGSMERPDRVAIMHAALKVLAQRLTPRDRISVVAFARTARLWIDGMAGGNVKAFLDQVLRLNPQGGTNFELAMDLGYATAARHFLVNGMNRVILLTDGAANLGNVEPEDLKQKVVTHRQKGIAFDCFGIGWEGYDDNLLEILSRNGDGRYGFLNDPEAAGPEFADELAGALNVAAADVKAQVEFNPNRVVTYRQIGYARHQLTKEQFRDNTVDAAEIAAAESGNAVYVIQVNPQGHGPLGTVRIRFKVPETGEYVEQAWPLPYQPRVPALEQASPALRLATTSAAFAEWLANSPYAAEVNLSALQTYLSGVPEVFAPDPRPQQLTWMIRQVRAITGK